MGIQLKNGLNKLKQRNSDWIKRNTQQRFNILSIRDMLVIQRQKQVENKKINKNILWKQQL